LIINPCFARSNGWAFHDNRGTGGGKNNMHVRLHVMLGLFLVSMALGWNVAAQSTDSASGRQKPEAGGKSPIAVATPGAADVDYHIGPQDVVQIDVWKESEITRTIPVRPDGKISLPLLNDVQAAGLTAMQLAGNIREGLTKYLNNPQVTVTVTQINSRRVFVSGEVARSGALPLLPGMTVLQALSTCGGFTQFAKEKAIYVLRDENGKQVKHPYNYKDVVKGKAEDTLLQPGDVIVVP
jgi:polysaccharide export outer membrane protein